MTDNICALNKNQNTCLPDNSIKVIGSHFIDKVDNLSKEEIIDKLSENDNKCKSEKDLKKKELCILESIKNDNNNDNLKKNINKHIINYFKPISKKLDKNYWINNTEIDNIQHQLLLNFPNYYYTCIHMIDLKMFKPQSINLFNEGKYIKSITDIDFPNELINKTTLNYNGELKYFGMVCNTDSSSGSGIHWFSIFIDFTLNPIQIEYFNSSGYDIKNNYDGKEFKKFFLNLADDISIKYKPCKFVKVTDIEHQRSDTANCGSYSLYYIWKRLNRTSSDYFANNQIIDEDMESFRKFLWRTHK